VARCLAAAKANAFVRRCDLPSQDRDDVCSQLMLTFLVRWPKYDSERASVRTFAARVMDQELWSIWRRHSGIASELLGGQVEELHAPSSETLRHFHVDLNRALADLPAVLRETADAIAEASTSETAARFGCTRQTVNRRKRLLRTALLAAGIGPDYFARGGAR
jgi:RNA polymerase sigma factor (sigma-70 family)